jgi:hypothetical protein
LSCAGEEVRQLRILTGSSSSRVATGASFGQIPTKRSTVSSRQVR